MTCIRLPAAALFAALFAIVLLRPVPGAAQPGTPDDPIIDSAMTPRQAVMENQPPDCPFEFMINMEVVDVLYWSMDGRVHFGQLVVRKDLANDLRRVFELILETRFPVASVKPVAHPDNVARAPYGFFPDTDNSSGFACREMVGGTRWSRHAEGLAFDLNPRQNPYISGDTVLPPGSVYDPDAPGTLTPDHPVVQAFKDLGWEWGGDWLDTRGFADYMHFQKVD